MNVNDIISCHFDYDMEHLQCLNTNSQDTGSEKFLFQTDYKCQPKGVDSNLLKLYFSSSYPNSRSRPAHYQETFAFQGNHPLFGCYHPNRRD